MEERQVRMNIRKKPQTTNQVFPSPNQIQTHPFMFYYYNTLSFHYKYIASYLFVGNSPGLYAETVLKIHWSSKIDLSRVLALKNKDLTPVCIQRAIFFFCFHVILRRDEVNPWNSIVSLLAFPLFHFIQYM